MLGSIDSQRLKRTADYELYSAVQSTARTAGAFSGGLAHVTSAHPYVPVAACSGLCSEHTYIYTVVNFLRTISRAIRCIVYEV